MTFSCIYILYLDHIDLTLSCLALISTILFSLQSVLHLLLCVVLFCFWFYLVTIGLIRVPYRCMCQALFTDKGQLTGG